ncbi:hypothetical protein CASFOL_027894 [Castilleja foliolosa]|uniref:RNase H type-1 domain-containing protein n=1 Tax=Castilleja foliolosa TaxID=1961234 RepID=A0ABD3CGY6_9LAMI
MKSNQIKSMAEENNPEISYGSLQSLSSDDNLPPIVQLPPVAVTSLPRPMSPSAVQSAGNRTAIIHFGPDMSLDSILDYVNGFTAAQLEYIFRGAGIAEKRGTCRIICGSVETKTAILASAAELGDVMIHSAGVTGCPLSIPGSQKLLSLPNGTPPPPVGTTKVNIDASFSDGSSTAGIIFRNHCGSITHAATFHHLCLDPFSAECLALLDACNLIVELNIKNVVLESDCLNAISFVVGNSDNCFWQASAVIEKIKCLWTSWPLWSFKFIPRTANGAAHALAFWAYNNGVKGFVPLNNLPVSIFCDIGYPILDPFN